MNEDEKVEKEMMKKYEESSDLFGLENGLFASLEEKLKHARISAIC
jgi:hypothetical protein